MLIYSFYCNKKDESFILSAAEDEEDDDDFYDAVDTDDQMSNISKSSNASMHKYVHVLTAGFNYYYNYQIRFDVSFATRERHLWRIIINFNYNCLILYCVRYVVFFYR